MDIDLSTNADTNAAADADAADATFDLAAAAAEAVEGLLQSKAKATAALPVGAIPLVLGKPATAFLMETTEPQLNLSGDTGSVGRLVVNAQDAAAPLVLDLKGLIFQGTVVPSNTFMLVTIGPNEARIDATVNNVIHTTCLGDALDSMTVVEGSIDADAFQDDAIATDSWRGVDDEDDESGAKSKGKKKKPVTKVLTSEDMASKSSKAAKKPSTGKRSSVKGGVGKRNASPKSAKQK